MGATDGFSGIVASQARRPRLGTAVCLIVPRTTVRLLVPGDVTSDNVFEHLFLTISRRNDTTKWGLPGGKVDAGESNIKAVQRETAEETGMIGGVGNFQPIYSARCDGETPYWVTTYLWEGYDVQLENLVTEPGFTLRWGTREELTNPYKSPFAFYNVGVFKAFDEYMGVYDGRESA